MIYNLALALLGLAGAAFVVRLAVGPRLADRVVALDGVLTTVALAIIANSARTDSTEYLVVAVVVALVAFVGTIVYARFIETKTG
ncbi:MAG: hypothetical protein KDB24_02940 [Microthrixaceae bacterium]|nr:hypothetical protein [Microthrixaceae bacterium]